MVLFLVEKQKLDRVVVAVVRAPIIKSADRVPFGHLSQSSIGEGEIITIIVLPPSLPRRNSIPSDENKGRNGNKLFLSPNFRFSSCQHFFRERELGTPRHSAHRITCHCCSWEKIVIIINGFPHLTYNTEMQENTWATLRESCARQGASHAT